MKKTILLFILIFFMSGCGENEIHVSFDTGTDGQYIDSITIVDGSFELPDLTFSDGYELLGWYYDEEFNSEYLDSHIIKQDTTLFAKITLVSHKITYVIEGYDVYSFEEVVIHGDNAVMDTPVLEGYTFYGWYVDESMISLSTGINVIMDTTLYGAFIENEPEVEIDIAILVGPSGYDESTIYELTYEGSLNYASENDKTLKYYKPLSLDLDDMIDVSEIAVSEGADVIVLPGFMYENIAYYLQEKYPDITIVIIDGTPNNFLLLSSDNPDNEVPEFYVGDNTISALFNHNELGFLAGYAAVVEGYTNLGYIGSVDIPPIRSYGIGFIAGAYYASYELELDITFNEGTYVYEPTFVETETLQAKAAFMYSIGVDVIFTTTMNGANSVVKAANFAGKHVINAELDTIYGPSSLVTTIMKGYDTLVYDLLDQYYNNSLPTGDYTYYGVDNDVVYIKDDNGNLEVFKDTIFLEITNDIKTGLIVIPDSYDALISFLGDDISNFRREIIETN